MTVKVRQVWKRIEVSIRNDYQPPKDRYFGWNGSVDDVVTTSYFYSPGATSYPTPLPTPPLQSITHSFPFGQFPQLAVGKRLKINALELIPPFAAPDYKNPVRADSLDWSNEIVVAENVVPSEVFLGAGLGLTVGAITGYLVKPKKLTPVLIGAALGGGLGYGIGYAVAVKS